jgi:type III pantothenate kinase
VGGGSPRWLLIGNSRWHWAEKVDGALSFRHHPAPPPLAAIPGLPNSELVAWAAVGRVPPEAGLPAERRLQLEDVPLGAVPPWLGIDRVLGGWQGWWEAGGSVLVVDAGTVLSLTRVDGEGRFAGGRLMAGVGLQQRAMVAGTAGLQALSSPQPGDEALPLPWPAATREAMASGVRRGLAAAIVAAAMDAVGEEPGCRIVITGGDGPPLQPLVAPELLRQGIGLEFRPELCLEALVHLRPEPEAGFRVASCQSRPRSERI